MSSSSATAISAPGKVLLAGGYLVVDRAHTGLVFGLSARIHVHVESLKTLAGVTISEIIVRSPQFRDAEWRYGYRLVEENGGIEVVQLKGHSTETQSPNRFVETALAFALTYVASKTAATISPVKITILADSDYYSQAMTSSKQPANPKSRFVDFNVSLVEAHKTGLGSSAALVTALTAAVLSHYFPAEREMTRTPFGKARIHNLAQAAHCTAQGKIGSGFDIAAAVYGSCKYRRFSPLVLEQLGKLGSQGFLTRLKTTVDDDGTSKIWNTEITESAVTLPKNLRLVMCDVDCGSETPGMVKRVFEWRKQNPVESALLWETLQKGNDDLASELQRLYLESNTNPTYQNLRDIILTIRSLIREMSMKADVPIEPKVQTDLLDACSRIPGVVGGVVPGAGGFDAIALLVEDHREAIDKLVRLTEVYQPEAGQGASIGKVRLLGVRQEMEGVKTEGVETYRGWL